MTERTPIQLLTHNFTTYIATITAAAHAAGAAHISYELLASAEPRTHHRAHARVTATLDGLTVTMDATAHPSNTHRSLHRCLEDVAMTRAARALAEHFRDPATNPEPTAPADPEPEPEHRPTISTERPHTGKDKGKPAPTQAREHLLKIATDLDHDRALAAVADPDLTVAEVNKLIQDLTPAHKAWANEHQ